ncbi:Fimbrial assembly protein (PilN) [compost metagenome]
MIKINLASSQSSGMGALGSASMGMSSDGMMLDQEVRKEGLKRALILLLAPLALYAYEQQNIPQKISLLNSKSAMLAETQAYNEKAAASVAEIKRFKEEELKIETRIAALSKIAKDRQREVRVLELLQNVLPEKAWLTRLDIKPDRVTIEGLALSDFEVSTFMESLTKSVYLMDVNLVSSKEEILEGMSLKRFEISCLLERPQ